MKKQTAGQDTLGNFAPKFAKLNDEVLFGEVWAREENLSLKIRSMITISTLMGKGITDNSLRYHLEMAKENGVSQTEMVEMLTHIAFYAGWPNAWAVFRLAKEVYSDQSEDDKEIHGGMFGLGEPNTAFSQYFVGNSYLKPLTEVGRDPLFIANVTFEPGCRNYWHIHQASSGGGQILLCVDGEGWYEEEGKPAKSLKPGDVVVIPANVKHWHGAKKDVWFSHLAIEVAGENTSTKWLEKVSDEEYPKG